MENFGLMCFVMFITIGIIVRQYAPKITSLPFTVIIMIMGMITGAIVQATSHAAPTIRAWYNIAPETLLWAIIPILVFESAFNTETHIFAKLKWQILTLAGPGVIVASILTAAFVKVTFVEYDWDWPTCLMFGAITAATDPVAVVALLKELGVSERLGTLIEGESLLNDGTAIVVFEVFYDALEDAPCDPDMPSVGKVFEFLFRLGGIGPILGCAIGYIATNWLGSMLNDPFNEICITLIVCYGSFGLADGVIGTSGVLTVCFAGMWINKFGKGRISASVEPAMHSFWGVLAHVSNVVVFFMTGLVMAVKVFGTRKHDLGEDCVRCGDEEEDDALERARRFLGDEEAEVEVDCHSFRELDIYYLIILYIGLHVVRGIVVLLSAPVLYKSVYGMTWQQLLVITYGGLRGAVGLALALIINDTDGFASRLQIRILFQIAGIAFLTLMINGTTTRFVLHALELDKISDAQNEVWSHVTVDADRKIAKEINLLRRDQYIGDADWSIVWRYIPVLTCDSYWFRIRESYVSLSPSETADLADWSGRRGKIQSAEEPGESDIGRRLVSAVRNWCFSTFTNRSGNYPMPPLLKSIWFGYHRAYGSTPPHFIHLSEARIGATDAEQTGGDKAADKVADARVRAYSHGEIFKAVKGSALLKDHDLTKHHALGLSVVVTTDGGSSSSIDSKVAATTAFVPVSDKSIAKARSVSPDKAVLGESRSRVLWAIKANYQTQFQQGRLSAGGLRALLENVEEQEDDNTKPIKGWELLSTYGGTSTENVEWLKNSKGWFPPGLGIHKRIDGMIFRDAAAMFEMAYNFVTAHEDIDVDEICDDADIALVITTELASQMELAANAIRYFEQNYPLVAGAVKTQVASRLMLIYYQNLLNELAEHGHATEKENEGASEAIDEMQMHLVSHPSIESPAPLDAVLGDVPFLAPLSQSERATILSDPAVCHVEAVAAGSTVALAGRTNLEFKGFGGWFVVVKGSVHVTQRPERAVAAIDPEEVVLTSGAVCCLEEQLLDLPFASTYRTVSNCKIAFFDRAAMHALAARNAAVRFSLWWSVALSALRGYEEFARLPARELDALSRHAKFVEAPDDARVAAQRQQRKKASFPYSKDDERAPLVSDGGGAPVTAEDATGYILCCSAPKNEPVEDEIPVGAGAGAAPDAALDDQPPREDVYLLDSTPMDAPSEAKDSDPKDDDDDDDLMLALSLPAGHSLLLLRGAAKTATDAGGALKVNTAITLITIDPTATSRQIRLGFAAKAFILDDSLLKTQGVCIHDDHDLVASDPSLANVKNTRASAIKQLNAKSPPPAEDRFSWLHNHMRSKARRAQQRSMIVGGNNAKNDP
ncbi:hypothetical protein CTAYLR_006856 [Chrysophaeum taylorii]|uniref:Cation/H+ exchanger transmembrane domain-containing protein n=1 Tax=Chrysophaeum taylorii TaxID=2483200 RepID=A0AAD7XJH6_9STRA|nr:hypothetical protein CTAYLR_006856 [Chrysophaeum taylorii]